MTAHAMKGDKETCLQTGMDSYISKPINSKELIAVLDLVINSGCDTVRPLSRDQRERLLAAAFQ
jgi:CheY-like chemotaxis protein